MFANQHSTQVISELSGEFGLEMVCPFLWGDKSPKAQHYAARWIYGNYAALAYSEFLRRGRGILAGPYAKGDDGLLLGCESLKEALFETGEMWTASVSYLPSAQDDLVKVVPQAEIRRLLLPTVNSYDPESEVPILLMRNGQPCVFLPSFRMDSFSPRYMYETASSRLGTLGPVMLPGAGRPQPSSKWKEADNFKPMFLPMPVS